MKKPSKDYKKLMNRIELLSFFRQKNKAILILNEHLATNKYSIYEKSSGLIRLGLLYVSRKDYKSAAKIFDEALLLVKNEKYPYHPNFKIILQTFQKASMFSLLTFWGEDFSKRIQYDKNFMKLKNYN